MAPAETVRQMKTPSGRSTVAAGTTEPSTDGGGRLMENIWRSQVKQETKRKIQSCELESSSGPVCPSLTKTLENQDGDEIGAFAHVGQR